MKVVRLEQVNPGDVTADYVRNSAGGVLMAPGTELTEAHLRRLKIAGIDTVPIGGQETQDPMDVAKVERRITDLNTRFAGVTDPLLLEIKKIAAGRLQTMLPATPSK